MLDTVSFYTPLVNTDTTRGYGTAGFNLVRSLQKLGVKVPYDESTAKVGLSFCQPHLYKFHPGQYKIGYTPWESTELPDGWAEMMNNCDEVWATSQWVATIYKKEGVTKPIFVLEHGLDPIWQPVKREPKDVVKFLHIGEPALRKGGQMTLDAFRSVFGDRTDVHLTFKVWNSHYLRAWKNGEIVYPNFDNVTIDDRLLSKAQLHQLHADHDVLVYPSYGEGFGFIPLQALGTGMPTISTGVWAPYRKFFGNLELFGRFDRSIWALHPGYVYYPHYDHLKYQLEYAADHLPMLHERFYAQAAQVHAEYNWLDKTQKAFEDLSKRVTET